MTIKIENNHPIWTERIVNVQNLGTYVQNKQLFKELKVTVVIEKRKDQQ